MFVRCGRKPLSTRAAIWPDVPPAQSRVSTVQSTGTYPAPRMTPLTRLLVAPYGGRISELGLRPALRI